MIKAKVIKELKELYSNAFIFLNNEENPTEIIAEVDPENGVSVAVIDKSSPHHHNHTVEKYIVQKGQLEVFIDGIRHVLNESNEVEILPGQVHSAVGDETWIKVICTPPWTAEDQIPEKS